MNVGAGIGFACIVGLIGFAIYMAIYMAVLDERQWEDFKRTHDCVVVEKIQGRYRTITTYGTDGEMHTGSIYEPGQTAWKCSDGVTYWR